MEKPKKRRVLTNSNVRHVPKERLPLDANPMFRHEDAPSEFIPKSKRPK
jgi:hypothetical protein